MLHVKFKKMTMSHILVVHFVPCPGLVLGNGHDVFHYEFYLSS